MKRYLLTLSMVALLGLPQAKAADVGVDLHLRFGDPVPAPVHIVEPPVFLYPPTLGFYVAVGVPYDCFYLDNYYYSYKGGIWYIAVHYGGPWHVIEHRHLPPGLLKHSYQSIIRYRDAEYNAYRSNRAGYKGKTFHPGKGYVGRPDKGPGKGRGDKPGKGHGKGRRY